MAITRNNTTITRNRDGATVCTLHSTEIVKVYPNCVVFDSGGWRTATTKSRMNECMIEWDLPFRVFQKNGDWLVRNIHCNGLYLDFHDGMQIEL